MRYFNQSLVYKIVKSIKQRLIVNDRKKHCIRKTVKERKRKNDFQRKIAKEDTERNTVKERQQKKYSDRKIFKERQ